MVYESQKNAKDVLSAFLKKRMIDKENELILNTVFDLSRDCSDSNLDEDNYAIKNLNKDDDYVIKKMCDNVNDDNYGIKNLNKNNNLNEGDYVGENLSKDEDVNNHLNGENKLLRKEIENLLNEFHVKWHFYKYLL